METFKAEFGGFQSIRDLKPLLNTPGPCLSLYMRLNGETLGRAARANAVEWKETLRRVQPKLAEFGSAGRQLLEGIADWDSLVQDQEPQGKSIAVFRSSDLVRATWVEEQVKSRAVIGPRFYVRPLLNQLI